MKIKKISLIISIISVIFICSCTTTGKKKSTEETKKYKVKELTISPDIEKYRPHKVGVMPFNVSEKDKKKVVKKEEKLNNKLKKELAKPHEKRSNEKILKIQESLTTSALEQTIDWRHAEKVRETFASVFSAKKYKDIEYYLIEKKLKENGYLTKTDIFKESPKQIGKLINADALIYGEIVSYNDIYLILASFRYIKCRAKMVSVKDEKVLWEALDSKLSVKGSAPTSITGIITTIADVIIEYVWGKKIEDFSFSLCRELVDSIPDEFISDEIMTPRIDLFSVKDNGKPQLTTADKIIFSLKGSPFNIAYCRIEGIEKDIFLDEDEKSPGNYSGEYIIQKGDKTVKSSVSAFLASSEDNKIFSTWIEQANINIDTQPPDVPSGFKVSNLEKEIIISWNPIATGDISGYRVYRSEDNVSGFQKAADVNSSEYKDTNIVLNKIFSYKFTSIDNLGNESDFSEVVSGIALKPGPTKIINNIKSETIWYKECSPYIISSVIKIEKTGKLTIMPGTIIRFETGGLEILGTIDVLGKDESPVIFESTKKKGFPEWGGIFFNRGGSDSVISGAIIKNAQDGILIKESSPTIKLCKIHNNFTGIKISGNATPKILNSSIIDNGEDGIYIDSSTPVIEGNDINLNLRNGIYIGETALPRISNNNIFDNQFFEIFSLSSNTIELPNNHWGGLNENEFYTEIWGNFLIKEYRIKKFPDKEINPYNFHPLFPADQSEYQKLEEEARWALKTSPAEAREKFLNLLNPANAVSGQIFKWLGIVERESNHTLKAIEYLKKALLIEPENDGIYYLLGKCYLDMNKNDEAIKAFKTALDINPNYEAARKELESINNK